LSFSFDSFFNDVSFFFKLSSARREDYASVAKIAGMVAQFAVKFGSTRWLCMKYVGVRALEQWPILKEYFLTFLPKQPGFKSSVAKTERYARLQLILRNPDSELYMAFMVFAAQDFDSFLKQFQYEQPMIHMLHPAMVDLIRKIMSRFVKAKYLKDESGSVHSSRDILLSVARDVKKHKSLTNIDIGTKAKLQMGREARKRAEASLASSQAKRAKLLSK
jgi:hypothetical protein